MDQLQAEELPDSWGRYASLVIPEVAVKCTDEGWRVRRTTSTPYVGLAKARLGRSQYAVGDVESDGSFVTVWQWDAGEDVVGDDEVVKPYLDPEVRP